MSESLGGEQVVSVVNTDTNLQYSTRFFGQMPLVPGTPRAEREKDLYSQPTGPSPPNRLDVLLTGLAP